jgi:polyphosphate kinase
MWLAPFHLHKQADREDRAGGEAAARGLDARIVAKMNALTDEAMMLALVRAGQRGCEDRPDRARRLHAAGRVPG